MVFTSTGYVVNDIPLLSKTGVRTGKIKEGGWRLEVAFSYVNNSGYNVHC